MRCGVFLPLIAALGVAVFQLPLEAAKDFSRPGSRKSWKKEDFHSQVGQDEFVYSVLYGLLGKRNQGYYLEIGAGEPIRINNTYFFEKNLRWSGVSIDISKDLVEGWYAARKNLLLSEDATRSDYSAILSPFPKVIDYLSLDVDEKYDVVLEKLFCSNHVFKIITIEHDFYRYGDLYRQRERTILSKLGYHLLCPNVASDGNVFEDWWIYPSLFPDDAFSKLTSLDLQSKDFSEILQKVKAATAVP